MVEIDPLTGLPKELKIGEILAKDTHKIKVRKTRRKFGKVVTVIEGINSKDLDIKKLAKDLKSRFACGGSYDEEKGIIELQGDHTTKIKQVLQELGFNPNSIELL